MTNEAIKVAIAEACGIKPRTKCPQCFGTGYGGSELDHIPCGRCRTSGVVKPYYDCPDYLNDLNAMHEAESTLTDLDDKGECRTFVECLRAAHYRDVTLFPSTFGLIHATAHQRAEAFLRVKGLWKE